MTAPGGGLAPVPIAPPEAAPVAAPAEAPAYRVLVVDDDAVDRMVVRRSLGRGPVRCAVDEAGSAEEALALVGAGAYDAVFLDYNLPGLDGQALLGRLRATGLDLPVVMLTGQGDEQLAVELMKAGAADYLPKAALTPARLLGSLQQAVALRRARAEARAATEALAATAERLRLATEAADLGIWDLDLTRDALALDGRALAILGLDPAAGAGAAPTRAAALARVHPDDHAAVQAALARALAPGGDAGYRVEARLVHADGAVRWIDARGRATFAPDPDGASRPVRLLGTVVDVTDRKRAEAALHEARTAAETANRAKSDFLAVMSHELRTPLNAIGGYAQLVDLEVHGPVTPAQHEAMTRIQRAQAHLLTLINDILHFAKLEAGHVRLHLAPVPLDAMLAGLEALVAPQLGAKGLRYVYRGGPAGVQVHADRDRLQQILVNLLGNAVKFTPAGGAVTLEWEAAADTVAVRVRDTGVGIPPDRLEAIFDPFVQLGRRGGDGRDGVGLGLSISRELARAMAGELTAASVPGAGATFTLTLPRADG